VTYSKRSRNGKRLRKTLTLTISDGEIGACEMIIITAESAASVAKDRENKEERLKKAREADRKEEEIRKEAVFRLHAAATLEIETAKEQNEILKNIRITRLAITIDNKDEEVTIDDVPPSSIAPAALGNHSKRSRIGTVDYRALAKLSRIREEIKRLN
jgi:hypothetical protein